MAYKLLNGHCGPLIAMDHLVINHKLNITKQSNYVG
jgi:hypothetical protein